MSKLLIIVGSSRPGRVGHALGTWMAAYAREHSTFDVSVADLAEINLPFFDEPKYPHLGDYQHDHTRAWADIVGAADAFIIVTAEYNHSFSAILKNALDFLSAEWRHKPVGFLAYGGGISGGTRAVESLVPVVNALRMIPTPASIIVPFAQNYVSDDGTVELPPEIAMGGQLMLQELQTLTARLRPETKPGSAAAS